MAKRPRRLCDKGHRVPSGTRANDPCPICAAHVALAARELLSAAGAAQERRYWKDGRKVIITSVNAGYGGHFRAVQGFKYRGEAWAAAKKAVAA